MKKIILWMVLGVLLLILILGFVFLSNSDILQSIAEGGSQLSSSSTGGGSL